jgi:hypothetical protein
MHGRTHKRTHTRTYIDTSKHKRAHALGKGVCIHIRAPFHTSLHGHTCKHICTNVRTTPILAHPTTHTHTHHGHNWIKALFSICCGLPSKDGESIDDLVIRWMHPPAQPTTIHLWLWIWISCLRSNEPCAVIAGPLPPKCEYCPKCCHEMDIHARSTEKKSKHSLKYTRGNIFSFCVWKLFSVNLSSTQVTCLVLCTVNVFAKVIHHRSAQPPWLTVFLSTAPHHHAVRDRYFLGTEPPTPREALLKISPTPTPASHLNFTSAPTIGDIEQTKGDG